MVSFHLTHQWTMHAHTITAALTVSTKRSPNDLVDCLPLLTVFLRLLLLFLNGHQIIHGGHHVIVIVVEHLYMYIQNIYNEISKIQ